MAPAPKEDRPRKKPGRVPTSCAECRRLKLRCDKNIPCGKCVSRGCSAICPDGQLASAKGHRLVLANTEELHDRIETLTSRVRDLEDGLRKLNESCTDRPHPLLKPELLAIKNPPLANFRENLHVIPPFRESDSASSSASPPSDSGSGPPRTDEENLMDAFGTLTIGPHGDSSFIGQTARTEYLLTAHIKPWYPDVPAVFPPLVTRLPKRISDIAFPDAEVKDNDLGREVYELLPPLSEAIRLCDTYLEHGVYLPFSLQRTELLDDVLDNVYRAGSFGSQHTHRSLSLLFSVFAIAALFDPNKPSYSVEAEDYYHLARTSLALSSPVRNPTIGAVQSLIHMAQYVDLSDWVGDTPSTNTAWLHLGTALRLSSSLGLHLDSERWQLAKEASRRRSRVYWQLFIHDTWMSFSLGRPPSLSMQQMDCPYPPDPPEVVAEDNGKGASFFTWSCNYSMLLHNVISSAFAVKPPAYNTILELDRKIRDFFVPNQLRPTCGGEHPSPPDPVLMQRFIVLQMKEGTLLNLHRAYFGQALQEQPDELASHRFVPSVMAAYRSAWRLIRSLVMSWRAHPQMLSRIGSVWSPALTAGLVMCMLVVRSPTSKMVPSAMEELDALVQLFQDASETCRFAAQNLPSMLFIHRKAQQSLDTSILLPCAMTPADLDRLGGKTHLIAAPHAHPSDQPGGSSGSGSSSSPSLSHGSRGSTSSNSASPREIPLTDNGIATPDPNNPANGMHPLIAEDMRSFDLGEPSLFYGATFSSDDMTGVQFSGLGGASSSSSSAFGAHPISGYAGTGGGFGGMGGVGSGAGGFGGFTGGSPLVLDATWQNFVEQLGFSGS
ncbi:Zn(2)-C6 fungal-type domain-containing protein [Mycena chlorophos]|uniref:Zn(2)-C6 fungal-type domain-containing protein n=1 Tax=Mycena chlorophos TaxID=658473 RepID=A0A8H6SNQ0_MYCCL|nr:Zn(2)-C6 fungal-type domain-containing protein [Mycena chlorophos]